MAKAKGMEAVIEKSSAANKKRKPAMKRKGGPGIAIMIAMGAPKKQRGAEMTDALDASKGKGMSKAQKIARLEEKIGYLKAELALLKADESEMDTAMEEEEAMGDEEEDEED